LIRQSTDLHAVSTGNAFLVIRVVGGDGGWRTLRQDSLSRN